MQVTSADASCDKKNFNHRQIVKRKLFPRKKMLNFVSEHLQEAETFSWIVVISCWNHCLWLNLSFKKEEKFLIKKIVIECLNGFWRRREVFYDSKVMLTLNKYLFELASSLLECLSLFPKPVIPREVLLTSRWLKLNLYLLISHHKLSDLN